MPWNHNPWAKELLSWHGHDRGGVQVPFQSSASPLGAPIETRLVRRLRSLTRSIARGDEGPRWLFLLGGPGNGKSEAVQDFLTHLDQALELDGALTTALRTAFAPHPFVQRRVYIEPGDLAGDAGPFAARVGHLIVIQDATATNDAHGDAAHQLVDDIAQLLADTGEPVPVFVMCANRGILARALKVALGKGENANLVATLLTTLTRASSLGLGALVKDEERLSCWPLAWDSPHGDLRRVACWPLDLESLCVPPPEIEGGTGPIEQIINGAVRADRWEVTSRCADCDAATLCPFRQNAEWLRASGERRALLSVLRRGELFTGQRWNFRDSFSLVAELIVGQWSDFGDADDPCAWVHARARHVDAYPGSGDAVDAVKSSHALLRRLYPHALFPGARMVAEDEAGEAERQQHAVSKAALDVASAPDTGSLKPIRSTLIEDYADLDPAIATPRARGDELRAVENDFNQSIKQGRDNLPTRAISLAPAEDVFLDLLDHAEQEWDRDLLGRRASQASGAVRLLRQVGCSIVKRSVGLRLGRHALETYLEQFEVAIHDEARLSTVTGVLQHLLGDVTFTFDMVESLGQPGHGHDRQATLEGPTPGLRVFPASTGSDAFSGHDMPFVEIAGEYRVPVTFEFYQALLLRSAHCANSSLPASVRAAINRVSQRYAGKLCRDNNLFLTRRASIVLGEHGKIVLASEGAAPTVETR